MDCTGNKNMLQWHRTEKKKLLEKYLQKKKNAEEGSCGYDMGTVHSWYF